MARSSGISELLTKLVHGGRVFAKVIQDVAQCDRRGVRSSRNISTAR